MDVYSSNEAGSRPAEAGLLTWIGRDIREHSLFTFLALILAIAAFRVAALVLNGTDLYVDEAQYWDWSRNLALGYFSKPPLIGWIIHAATSVCGDSEACIRLPSVLLHLATSILVYLIAWRLYSEKVAFWSGLGYALLPAVSLSSGIISTDVPLLAAWALALFAFAGILNAPNMRDTALLALALGAGLNAKYAMAYFILCAALYFALVPQHRNRLREPHLWLALLGGLALILPNILWNMSNGFVTFAHTADNANWRGIPFHPDKAAEFILAQFGVFGPILFGALLVICWRAVRQTEDVTGSDKLLLAFSMPIIALVTAQGLASRAHANWAAPAYIAAVVVVTAVMIRRRDWAWMRASFALHGLLALAVAGATWRAGRLALPVIGDPFARTLGNRALAEAVKAEVGKASAAGHPVASILTDDRDIAAAIAYYARDMSLPQLAWRTGYAPRSHFEITQPFTSASPTPALLVSEIGKPALIAHFRSVSSQSTVQIPAGQHARRTVRFVTLSRFEER